MKTNILKNLRWAVCAALLAVGSTAFADTATSTFTGVTGSNGNFTFTQSSSSTAGVTWTSNAKKVEYKSSAVRVTQGQSDQYYIFGSVPSNWVITKITFESAVTNGTAIDLACYVNGVQFSAVSGASYSYEGNQLSNGTISITVPAHGSWGGNYMGFTGITIEYTTTVIPTITWPTTTTNYTSTSGIVIKFSCDMSIKNSSGEYLSINSADAFALVYGAFGVMDGTSAEDVAYTIVVNSKNQVTLTPTGVVDCSTYSAYVGEELVASNGYESVPTNGRDWEFTTVGENLVVTGKTSLLLNETFTPKTDLVVKVDGVDVTSECTFSTINTATAGSQTLTITHGACITTQVITITERTPCTITWVNNVTGETLAQSTVYQGISLSESGLTTLPSPSTKVAETDCGTKSFVGWSKTQISGSTDEAPTLITTSSVPNAATYTFYAVYADGSSTTEGWTKVTSISELPDLVGKQILFATTAKKYVMGKINVVEKTTNFSAISATIASDETLTPSEGYTAVTLGGTTDAWTFYTENGYLNCGSTSSISKLNLDNNIGDSTQWKISEAGSNLFNIVSNKSVDRNLLKYMASTSNNGVFSCYKSNSTGASYVNIYYNASHTGYITKCQCTTPTWSGSLPTSIEKGSTLSFGITSNSTGAITYSCSNSNVTITGDKFQVSASGSYEIVIKQAAANGYCKKEETRTMTISVGDCSAQSIYWGEGSKASYSTWEHLCFDTDADERHIYSFTIPSSGSKYIVGWKNDNGDKSSLANFSDLPFALLQGKSGGCNTTIGWSNGVGQGAVGTLRIYHNSGSANWYVGFIPDGYVFRIGTDALGWTSMAFTATNDTKTVWETELVTLTANNIASNYYVGLKTNTTDGYVWCNNSATLQVTSIGVRSENNWSGSNLSSSYVGKKGTFRIWADNCDGKNWLCHFVPYYDVTYMNADNSTVFETSSAVSIEATDKSMTIISTNPEKTGYRFVGWSETAGATTATYTAGASITLTKNHVLYPVYVQQVTLTYDANGGTSECGTPQYDINSTADLCTEVERTGYAYKGWSKAKDDATQIVTGSITMNANQTLYAIWEKCLTVTYLTSGLTLDGGCSATQTTDASGNTLVAGSKVTLCAKPTSNSGYTFVKWKVSMDGAETEYDASATVTLSADATVQATWDTPDITLNFFNQGGGVNNESRITVTVPLETYATAPTTTNVPQSCDGKQFIGWINAVLSEGDEDEKFSIDDETKYESVDDLTQAGFTFLSPGEKFMVTNTTPKTWYAVFGTPE